MSVSTLHRCCALVHRSIAWQIDWIGRQLHRARCARHCLAVLDMFPPHLRNYELGTHLAALYDQSTWCGYPPMLSTSLLEIPMFPGDEGHPFETMDRRDATCFSTVSNERQRLYRLIALHRIQLQLVSAMHRHGESAAGGALDAVHEWDTALGTLH